VIMVLSSIRVVKAFAREDYASARSRKEILGGGVGLEAFY